MYEFPNTRYFGFVVFISGKIQTVNSSKVFFSRAKCEGSFPKHLPFSEKRGNQSNSLPHPVASMDSNGTELSVIWMLLWELQN